MKPLYILKIGGSVATNKNQIGLSIRRNRLKKIARAIKQVQKKKDFNLILIHGSGSAGHHLAHKYNLGEGVLGDKIKKKASLDSRFFNQTLNTAILKIFLEEGLSVVSAHTASLIIQKNKKIWKFNTDVIKTALKQGYMPLLYGEMVFDEELGMTICSGDAIAPYLARELNAKKIFFATDVDGIYDKDPYFNKNARLIENIKLLEIKFEKNIKLSGSHNMDSTDGLSGKLKKIISVGLTNLKVVEIFNGINEKNFEYIFLEKYFPHSVIHL